jgi:hypothetical protein
MKEHGLKRCQKLWQLWKLVYEPVKVLSDDFEFFSLVSFSKLDGLEIPYVGNGFEYVCHRW